MLPPLTNLRGLLRTKHFTRQVKNTVRNWPRRPPANLRIILNDPALAYALYLDALEWQMVTEQEPRQNHTAE